MFSTKGTGSAGGMCTTVGEIAIWLPLKLTAEPMSLMFLAFVVKLISELELLEQ